MRKGKFGLGPLVLAAFLALTLCEATLPDAAMSANGDAVGMVIEPIPMSATVGDTFSVDIKVTIGADEAVNTAEAHIDFDPTYLEVVGIGAGTTLPNVLPGGFDNTLGTIDYTAGAQFLEAAPTTTFVLATLTFKARAATTATPLTFVFEKPMRNTATHALVDGNVEDVLDHAAVIGGRVQILPLGGLSGHVDLQGRPTPPDASWVTPLTVVFFTAGTDIVVRTEEVSTDNHGNFAVADVETGTYDIGVKCSRSLSELATGVAFSADTVTPVTFGTLREGDANNDDVITGADYSVLYSYLGQTSGEALDKSDFNRDGVVNAIDYSLLWMNLAQVGDMYGMWP